MNILHATLTTWTEAATTAKWVAASWKGRLRHLWWTKGGLRVKGGGIVGEDNERRRVGGERDKADQLKGIPLWQCNRMGNVVSGRR